jgi:3-hydroxybutyrate dehydrogenase
VRPLQQRLAQEGCSIVLNGFGARSEIEAQRRELEETHGVRALYHDADWRIRAKSASSWKPPPSVRRRRYSRQQCGGAALRAGATSVPVAVGIASIAAINVSSAFHTYSTARGGMPLDA